MSPLDVHTDGLKGWERRQLDEERRYLEQQSVLEQIEAHAGGIASAMKAAPVGDVLAQQTAKIGAQGLWTLSWPVQFLAASVANTSATALTILAGSPAGPGAPPAVGAGVFSLPAGIMRTVSLRGQSITVYGAPGTLFDIAIYSRPKEATAGPCGPGGLNIPMSQKGALSGVAALSATGSVLSAVASDASGTSTALGTNALAANASGAGNLAAGTNALAANTTGSNNVALGYRALANNNGSSCIAIGEGALFNSTGANGAVAIGFGALYSNTTGDGIAIGANALGDNLTSVGTVAIGANAKQAADTGGFHVAIGSSALTAYTGAAGGLVAIGSSSLAACTTGTRNVGVGQSTMINVTTAAANTAVGDNALSSLVSGQYNTAIGTDSMKLATGNNNTAAGVDALSGLTTGANNTALGVFASGNGTDSTVTGNNNTHIGYQSGVVSPTDPSYTLSLGSGALCGANGAVAIGTDSAGTGASTSVANTIALGTPLHTTQILGTPAFVAGDLYLVVDASGHIHKSSIGPAS